MGFFKRVVGLLGFGKEGGYESNDGEKHGDDLNNRVDPNHTRRGFSVAVRVPVDRAQIGPLLLPCDFGDGGVQDLRWYARRLKIDDDGDIADEFFDEVLGDSLRMKQNSTDERTPPTLKVKHSTNFMPAIVKNQVLSLDGRIQQSIEHRGKLQWI